MDKIIIVCKYNVNLSITKEAALKSELFRGIIKSDEEEEDNLDEIPVPKVNSDIMEFVIEFCEHHVNDPFVIKEQPLNEEIFKESINDWDFTFINKDLKVIMAIMDAANLLNIQELLNLTCAKIASMINTKKPSEILEMFDHREFTLEEEEQVRKDYLITENGNVIRNKVNN